MHSILLGSWAEGGVLAVLLPAWLLVACLGVVWNITRFGRWAPLAVTVALQGIWDLIYAPWTYNTIAEYACIALLFCAVHFRATTGPAMTPNVSAVIPTIGRPSLAPCRAVRARPDTTGRRDHRRRGHGCDRSAAVRRSNHVAPQRALAVVLPDADSWESTRPSGSVIALLDDDDEWHTTKLARQLEAVDSVAGAHWIASSQDVGAGSGYPATDLAAAAHRTGRVDHGVPVSLHRTQIRWRRAADLDVVLSDRTRP